MKIRSNIRIFGVFQEAFEEVRHNSEVPVDQGIDLIVPWIISDVNLFLARSQNLGSTVDRRCWWNTKNQLKSNALPKYIASLHGALPPFKVSSAEDLGDAPFLCRFGSLTTKQCLQPDRCCSVTWKLKVGGTESEDKRDEMPTREIVNASHIWFNFPSVLAKFGTSSLQA